MLHSTLLMHFIVIRAARKITDAGPRCGTVRCHIQQSWSFVDAYTPPENFLQKVFSTLLDPRTETQLVVQHLQEPFLLQCKEPSHRTSNKHCFCAAPHFRCSCAGCRVRKLFVANPASIADSLAVSRLADQSRELGYTYLVPRIDDVGTVMPARCSITLMDESACRSLHHSSLFCSHLEQGKMCLGGSRHAETKCPRESRPYRP